MLIRQYPSANCQLFHCCLPYRLGYRASLAVYYTSDNAVRIAVKPEYDLVMNTILQEERCFDRIINNGRNPGKVIINPNPPGFLFFYMISPPEPDMVDHNIFTVDHHSVVELSFSGRAI